MDNDIDTTLSVAQKHTLDQLITGILKPNGFGHWRTFDSETKVLTVGAGHGVGIQIDENGAIL